ncbi:glycosyltransferase [Terracoccus luteus]|uniref:Glycosyltransferase involved in cell wall biosynthesis n=1 Tax=Terracoccus luteus TaxID=53356 RepID=A0A839Q082_9MICO|nr:glycosyltransferase involved in cell wall biosynthesis [Terracoccus luteus]
MRSPLHAVPTPLLTPLPTPLTLGLATRRTRRPLRIGVIGPWKYPLVQPFAGGLESHVSELTARLRQLGHDVSLFAREGSTGVATGDELESGWIPSLAATRDVSMPSMAAMLEHHAYQRLLLRLVHGEAEQRFDLIHIHAVHHLPVAMAPSLPVPVIATLHTPPTAWLESTLAVTRGAGVRFTAVSSHVSKAWSVLEQRPEVVLNGVDTDVWRAGPGGGRVVWSGRLVPEKAPHLAIRAARLAGRPITIAGPVSDPDYVRREIAPLLGDDVTYAGHLGQQSLAALVGSAAVVLATPVWEEPFGLTVAEALSCGTPVVAFDRGGIREVIGSSGSGVLVPADDVAAMAAAIPLAERIDREAVRRHAERRLSLGRMVERYVDLYRVAVRAGHDPEVSRGVVTGQAQALEALQPALHREPAPLLTKMVGVADD